MKGKESLTSGNEMIIPLSAYYRNNIKINNLIELVIPLRGSMYQLMKYARYTSMS